LAQEPDRLRQRGVPPLSAQSRGLLVRWSASFLRWLDRRGAKARPAEPKAFPPASGVFVRGWRGQLLRFVRECCLGRRGAVPALRLTIRSLGAPRQWRSPTTHAHLIGVRPSLAPPAPGWPGTTRQVFR